MSRFAADIRRFLREHDPAEGLDQENKFVQAMDEYCQQLEHTAFNGGIKKGIKKAKRGTPHVQHRR